jgi:hypothetical protein|uniref:Uncharacterized protein n=1 Tax=viral metagenome TaxID=1070528 RepID=A0A6C0IKV4_9ZZZZ
MFPLIPVLPIILAIKGNNDKMEKQRIQRTKTINARRRDENKVYKRLQPVKKEERARTRQLKKQTDKYNKIKQQAENTKKMENSKENTRNNYRDNINVNLLDTKQNLDDDVNKVLTEYNISDDKNKTLLSSLITVDEEVKQEKLNIYGKTQQVYDQLSKQNNHLDKTLNGLTQKRIDIDRRSTYQDHIKMEYSIANLALWYVYYILLAILVFMYRRQNKLNQPYTIAVVVALLIFPYFMFILEVMVDILANIKEYTKQSIRNITGIPDSIHRRFESLF